MTTARSDGSRTTAQPAQAWRTNLAFAVLGVFAVTLCARLAVLVKDGGGMGAAMARRQQRMVVPLAGRPGSIYLRTRGSYVALAASRQTPCCYVDPFLLGDEEIPELCIGLGEALSLDPMGLQEMIFHRRDRRYAAVKESLTAREVQALGELSLPAVGINHRWQRDYANADLAGTVVGFRQRDGQAGGGLELSLDRYLAATDGRRVMLADARRRPIWPVPADSRPPKDGCNVFLTLDAVIQEYLQAAVSEAVAQFDAKWGTGVVVDPFTGEILAMCSTPTFDPTEYSRTPAAARTNRVVCVPFEPGSAAKPIFAAAAVDAGMATYDTQFFCENGTYLAHRGGRISDHGSHYGLLTLTDVVVHSSNIGMAKVGEKLGNTNLHTIARRFGFGSRTGIEQPGESPGIIRPLHRWDGYSLRRVPFGQEISVTTLQLAMAFSALANGGLLMEPHLVASVRSPQGEVVLQGRPKVVRRVLSPSVAAQSLAVLQQVIERGTGKACRMSRWTSFGKTGTAQIPGPGGYVDGAYTGSFLGGAPVNRPRAICLISIFWPDRSKGYYGAKVAAPFVKKVLEQTLTYWNISPDRPVEEWSRSSGLAAARR